MFKNTQLRQIAFFTYMLLFCAQHLRAQTADFTADRTSGCSPLIVNFTNRSRGNIDTYAWEISKSDGSVNPTFSDKQNPSISLLSPGTYDVKLTVTSGTNSNTKESSGFLIVYATPDVHIQLSALSVCVNSPITLEDLSTPGDGTITDRKWDFGDGSPIESFVTGVHTYQTGGVYYPQLVVTNSFGCQTIYSAVNHPTEKLDIQAPPVIDFTYKTSSCTEPILANFVNNTKAGTNGAAQINYEWDFGDNSAKDFVAAPTHTYATEGDYTVTLTARNANALGCQSALTQPIHFSTAKPDFTWTSPCAGDNIIFTNTSKVNSVSAQWDLGDGSPVVNGDNANHVFAGNGVYNVKLTINTGSCILSQTSEVSVSPKPTVAFATVGDATGCHAPFNVSFTNSSTGENLVYKWDFGDGNTSTDVTPVHTYISEGAYKVTLTAYNADYTGCSNKLEIPDYIKIRPPKIILFQNLPQIGCTPLVVSLGANIDSDDPITAYQWTLGDGTTSAEATPVHTYDKEGSYRIDLVITTRSGCQDWKFFPDAVKVGPKPIASFVQTGQDICGRDAVPFQNTSTGATSYKWEFGDGGESTEQDPTHIYTNIGDMTVKLTAYNEYCASETFIAGNILKVKGPVDNIEIRKDCASPYARDFIDKSHSTQWSWNLGDGTTATTQDILGHNYAGKGIYQITMHGSDPNTGCDIDIQRTVNIVDEGITPSVHTEALCRETKATFIANGYDDINNIQTLVWDYGDGNKSDNTNNPEKEYTYFKSGTYQPKLSYTDINGCTKTVTLTPVDIKSKSPIAAIGMPASSCLYEQNVHFTDQSTLSTTDNGNTIVERKWDFGDQTMIANNDASADHRYANKGLYLVTFSVTDKNGCADTVKNRQIIIAQPEAKFSLSSPAFCNNYNIPFTNQSDGDNLSYNWDFGDGKVSSALSPVHAYSSDGTYTASLTVTDQYNCVNTFQVNNPILISNPTARFQNNDVFQICPPLEILPTNQSLNASSVIWDFGDGNTSTDNNMPSHLYTQGGIYTLKLTAIGIGGCRDETAQTLTVQGPSGKFDFSPKEGCAPTNVHFVAQANKATSFIWDFDNGNTQKTNGTQTDYAYHEAGKGIFYPRLIMTDDNNCTVSVQSPDPVVIHGTKADVQNLSDQFACDLLHFNLMDKSSVFNDNIAGYKWAFGNNANYSSEQNPPEIQLTQSGQYPFSLTVRSGYGCTDTYNGILNATVATSPRIQIAAPDSVCIGSNLPLQGINITQSVRIAKWEWGLGDGKSIENQNITYSYATPGDYSVQLTATSQEGCTGTFSKQETVVDYPQINAGNDQTICEGAIATLNASGNAQNYVWDTDPTLSCQNCETVLVSTTADRTYAVTGKGLFGCDIRDEIKITVIHPQKLLYKNNADICLGDKVQLQLSGTDKVEWTIGTGITDIYAPTQTVSPPQTYTYTAVGTDRMNCFTDQATIIVTVHPLPTVALQDAEVTLNYGTPYQVITTNSPDVIRWEWTPAQWLTCSNCAAPVIRPGRDMEYRLQVYNAAGCQASTSMKIKVLCNGANLFVPNTFSPNNDGVNDIFYPRSNGDFTIRYLRVYNRWGQCVFERNNFHPNDKSSGWDGKYKGQVSGNDVFVYEMAIICTGSGEPFFVKGDVTLAR